MKMENVSVDIQTKTIVKTTTKTPSDTETTTAMSTTSTSTTSILKCSNRGISQTSSHGRNVSNASSSSSHTRNNSANTTSSKSVISVDASSASSSSSRKILSKTLSLHESRHNVTSKELQFLTSLIMEGNDDQVTAAQRVLSNPEAFPSEIPTHPPNRTPFAPTPPTQRSSTPPIPPRPPRSSYPSPSTPSQPKMVRRAVSVSTGIARHRRVGSDSVHARLWKAHQCGLMVSPHASMGSLRKSLHRRSVSITAQRYGPGEGGGGGVVDDGMVGRRSDSLWSLNSSSQGSLLPPPPPPPEGEPSSPCIGRDITISQSGSSVSRASPLLNLNRSPHTHRPTPLNTKNRRVSFDRVPSVRRSKDIISLSDEDISLIPPLQRAERLRSESTIGGPSIDYDDNYDATAALKQSVSSMSGDNDFIANLPPLAHAQRLRSEESILGPNASVDSGEVRVSNALPPRPRPRSLRDLAPHPAVKPVLMRKASRNVYEGEGVEVMEAQPTVSEMLEQARNYGPMLSLDDSVHDILANCGFRGGLRMSRSYDQRECIFRDTAAAPPLQIKSSILSQSSAGTSWNPEESESSVNYEEPTDDHSKDDHSTELQDSLDYVLSQSVHTKPSYQTEPSPKGSPKNTWHIMNQQDTFSHLTPSFLILGTSADDEAARPHVLSPPLMEALQNFVPLPIADQNFWLKYSLLKDGASLYTALKNVRGSQYTILAIETLDGEVFGSFTGVEWRMRPNGYFGTGEAFLWKMRRERTTGGGGGCRSIIDQARMESELDVYPWTGENDFVQLVKDSHLAVGGCGSHGLDSAAFGKLNGSANPLPFEDLFEGAGGFGLIVDDEFMTGHSSPCATFNNPCLTKGKDGMFEIANLEIWTLTPCMTESEAEKNEFQKLFFEGLRNEASVGLE